MDFYRFESVDRKLPSILHLLKISFWKFWKFCNDQEKSSDVVNETIGNLLWWTSVKCCPMLASIIYIAKELKF